MGKPLNIDTPSKIKKIMKDMDDKDSDVYKSLSDKQKALLENKTVTK